MHRVRILVLKAPPTLDHTARPRILITSFIYGLHDRQLAASLVIVNIQTAAEAERLAAEREVVRKDQKSKNPQETTCYQRRVIQNQRNTKKRSPT